MIVPTEKDIGRVVLYQGGHPDDRDRGVITSFHKRECADGSDCPAFGGVIVFVRYGTSLTSQATSAADLTWENGAAGEQAGG